MGVITNRDEWLWADDGRSSCKLEKRESIMGKNKSAIAKFQDCLNAAPQK